MIKALEIAIEKAKRLPREQQEYAAGVPERIAGTEEGVYVLPDRERRLGARGTCRARPWREATDKEMRVVFGRYRA
jgi:hypothetical protein